MAAMNARNCTHTHTQRSTFSTYGLWCDIKFCHQWYLVLLGCDVIWLGNLCLILQDNVMVSSSQVKSLRCFCWYSMSI